MKTTVELPDGLLTEARRVARREGTTLKALLEQGLRRTLAERAARPRFTLRDGSVEGRGLHPDADGADWQTLRDLSYRGRGA